MISSSYYQRLIVFAPQCSEFCNADSRQVHWAGGVRRIHATQDRTERRVLHVRLRQAAEEIEKLILNSCIYFAFFVMTSRFLLTHYFCMERKTETD